MHCTAEAGAGRVTVLGFGDAADVRRLSSYSHVVARGSDTFKGAAELLVITSRDLVELLQRLEDKDCSTREKLRFLKETRAFREMDERKL